MHLEAIVCHHIQNQGDNENTTVFFFDGSKFGFYPEPEAFIECIVTIIAL